MRRRVGLFSDKAAESQVEANGGIEQVSITQVAYGDLQIGRRGTQTQSDKDQTDSCSDNDTLRVTSSKICRSRSLQRMVSKGVRARIGNDEATRVGGMPETCTGKKPNGSECTAGKVSPAGSFCLVE
ncbi:hypothetical protein BHM03_00047988 [Ensete ventricosum]|nr:hypothetical protein BHM03_00047988 [Ensete ventricosum]